MRVTEFDYDLPPERIAQWPLDRRDASRLLLLDRHTGVSSDRQFRELPDLLRGDELMILNNARVFPARLLGHRSGIRAQPPSPHSRTRSQFLQSPIEVLLVRQLEPMVWEALVKPGRKIPIGEVIIFGGSLQAEVIGRGPYGLRRLRFAPIDDLALALDQCGHIPLPLYIKRPDDAADRERYQTVYASYPGAVAAPTAGLHFTPEILACLRQRGVEIVEITLWVGLGTFEPVRTEILEQHAIHTEAYRIPESVAQAVCLARRNRRPVLAVGTTVVRALEDAADKVVAQRTAAGDGGESVLAAGNAEANVFLYPGKPFRVVDQMLTNFHLPQSSLLALVAGFAGLENILQAYRHAVAAGYRFYSYGDCMLIRGTR
jgi:S-adenosylmethionine:tRNA ribosyltransferase-isomerase